MDPTRFDEMARRITGGSSTRRRALLTALGGALLGAGIGLPDDLEAHAKQRRRHKKRKCLFGQRRCRDRRCHGCCNDADCGGNVCETGTCSACPRGQRLCRGGCIPEASCCADSECTGGRVCVDGSCACGPNRRECNGVCIGSNECCGTDCPAITCGPNQRECDGFCIGVDECCGTDCPVKTCGPENCNGCCDGTTCRDGDSLNFCGRNGFTCLACDFRESCIGSGCVCEKECCRNADCTGTNVRCNRRGTCESCTPDGAALPGGCGPDTVGLCCSGTCSGAVCGQA